MLLTVIGNVDKNAIIEVLSKLSGLKYNKKKELTNEYKNPKSYI